MRDDLAESLSREWPHYWSPELRRLPDGWTRPLTALFESILQLNSIDATSDKIVAAVRLRYEIQPSSAAAYATPTMHVRWWTPARSQALIAALDQFHSDTQSTCVRCGSDEGMLRMRFLDGVDTVMCDECAG